MDQQRSQATSAGAAPPRFTRTPIYKAIIKQDLPGLHRALNLSQDQGRDLIRQTDEQTRFSYLHLVPVVAEPSTEESLVPFVYALSNAGVDLEAVDCKQRTALHIAVHKKLFAIVTALLRVGCDQSTNVCRELIDRHQGIVRRRLSEIFDKFSPGLWSAVTSNDLGTVYILVNSWCRINIVRKIDDVTSLSLIGWARIAGASGELVRLLEGYESTLEFVHATLSGGRERMLQLLQTSRCDLDIMDISYQDDWTSPLRPQSLRDAAERLGHQHIMDLLSADASRRTEADTNPTASQRPLRPRRNHDRSGPVTVHKPEEDMAMTKLDLSFTDNSDESSEDSTHNPFFSRSLPQYHSLRDSCRRMAHRRQPSNQNTHTVAQPNVDHIATPRKSAAPEPPKTVVKHSATARVHFDDDATPKAERKFGSVGAAASRKLKLDLSHKNNTAVKVVDGEDGDLTPTDNIPTDRSTDLGAEGGAGLPETPRSSSRRAKKTRKFPGSSQAKKIHSTLCVIS